MLPEKLYRYLLIDLDSAPDVLAKLLAGVSDPAVWDRRPDPERFTLREVAAHLADWDKVFLGRMIQTRDAAQPILQGIDEGQVALDQDYAHTDPLASLRRHRVNRTEMVSFLQSLSADQWDRVDSHTELGPISLAAQAVLVAVHDGYHRRQVVCYVSLFEDEAKNPQANLRWEVKDAE